MSVRAAYWYKEAGNFAMERMNSGLFSHLFCAFADLNTSNSKVVISPTNAKDFSQFTSVVQRKNPFVRTLLSIGGGGGEILAGHFADMAASASARKSFIDSSIQVARSNAFHGLDLDYEYPRNQSDMSNLGILISDWRKAVDMEAKATNRTPLLLTAAVRYKNTNFQPTADPYPAKAIATSLDWINVMSYDFTSPEKWGTPNKTGPTASLNDPTNPGVSGSSVVNAWIQAGVPASKIVLGIPFYGYAWRLVNPSNHGYGAPANGPAMNKNGEMSYREIKNFMLNNHGGGTVYDPTKAGNYCYQGNTWISYDDVQAVSAKAQFVRQKGLLGYFAWHVGADDDNSDLAKAARSSADEQPAS